MKNDILLMYFLEIESPSNAGEQKSPENKISNNKGAFQNAL